MRKFAYRPYVLLILLLFFILSIPPNVSDTMRSFSVAIFSPPWRGFDFIKCGILNIGHPISRNAAPDQKSLEFDRLVQENQILKSQIESVREWLIFEERIESQLERLKEYSEQQNINEDWKDFYKRRNSDLYNNLELQLQSVPARVIYREPGSWSSSVWLNVGNKQNEILGKKIIAKNSPVLSGRAIVGVVEYVGRNQSRVRLITDSGLVPSVRAVRGAGQNRFLIEHLEALISGLQHRYDLFAAANLPEDLLQQLQHLKMRLIPNAYDYYLAKGELYGSSSSLWRSRSQVLRGVGFNYDYADDEGPARDPRTGETMNFTAKQGAIPILQLGDLLVTTGMDGVFPAGFEVAVITKVGTLREGGVAYEIEAKACAGNLEELKYLFVLPPLDFENPN